MVNKVIIIEHTLQDKTFANLLFLIKSPLGIIEFFAYIVIIADHSIVVSIVDCLIGLQKEVFFSDF